MISLWTCSDLAELQYVCRVRPGVTKSTLRGLMQDRHCRSWFPFPLPCDIWEDLLLVPRDWQPKQYYAYVVKVCMICVSGSSCPHIFGTHSPSNHLLETGTFHIMDCSDNSDHQVNHSDSIFLFASGCMSCQSFEI